MQPTKGNPFTAEGNWCRGNTHSHTTASDGQLTVPELAGWYDEHGYDFLVVTDHDVVADLSVKRDSSILLIPGCEIGVCWDGPLVSEICALGIDEVKRVRAHPQDTIDDVRAQGGLTYVSHPHLSGVYSGLMMELEGLTGLEVYNAIACVSGRGSAATHWDDLMFSGKQAWAVASDDRHSGLSDDFTDDKAKAWVMVRAAECTREGIMAAMRDGLYYSTTGPEIHDIEVTSDGVRVKCSEARTVTYSSLPWHGSRDVAKPGEMLVESFAPAGRLPYGSVLGAKVDSWIEKGYMTRVPDMGRYVRVEIWDGADGYAWSNPVPLEESD